jgi:broad specificity phosphatase PhoE
MTCSLSGFGENVTIDPDLLEWDYGKYEGLKTPEIHKLAAGWQLFRDGCPDGESPEEVSVRATRFINRIRNLDGDLLAFSSGHIIRMIAACWLGLPPQMGRIFYCPPASIGMLGYAHNNRNEPVLQAWNCA